MRSRRRLWYEGRLAFSLLELMIVIILISLVYALVFASMQQKQKEPKAMQIENLKSTLLEQGLSHAKAEFFCLDKCQKCYLYQNQETTEYEGKLALGDLTVYHMGSDGKLEKIDFGRYQDHSVCLRFKLYNNGSSSQMVIQNKTGTYYLPARFGKPVKTASIEEAETLWLKRRDLLGDSGEYY